MCSTFLQFAGVLLALALPFRDWRKLAGGPGAYRLPPVGLLLAIVLPPGIYDDPIAASRILAPLLIFQFLAGRPPSAAAGHPPRLARTRAPSDRHSAGYLMEPANPWPRADEQVLCRQRE